MFTGVKASGQLVAQFTADVVSGCSPIRVVFKDSSTGGATDWKWDLGNGTIAEHTSNPSTTYFTPGLYTVKLVVYKSPTDSAQVIKINYITVYTTPVIDFGASVLSGCLPLAVQFRDASNVGGIGMPTYQWDFGDGNIGSGKNPLHIYNSPGNFKVTLTIKNGAGCGNSGFKLNYITVFDSIKASFGFKAPATCSVPASYNFLDSSTGNGIVKWNWDFGDGNTSTLKNPTHIYNTEGQYSVRLIIQNTNGCSDTVTKVNAITPGSFNAAFTSPASVCAGQQANFTNSSVPTAQVDSSRWFFGDGTSLKAIEATHNYATAGSYNVKLITWFGKCTDSAEKAITVLPGPITSFSATPTAACKPPLNVQFNNMTTGGTVVKWLFGNGTTSTVNNPLVTYDSYGRFDVTLIVQNASGCIDTLVKNDFIIISKPAIGSISGLPYRNCMPWTNTFSANVGVPVAAYSWDFGDGTTSTDNNPAHTFTDTSLHLVKVTITTTDGCTATYSDTVHGGMRPKANFSGTPNDVCRLTPVVFSNLSSSIANSWFWDFGDGSTSTDWEPEHLYVDTGYKTVTLVAYNNGCADTVSFIDYVHIIPPIARFNESFDCTNKYKRIFTDNSIGGKYWKWYISSLDSIEAKDIEYTFPDTGFYVIRLYVKDSLCEDETSQTIHIVDEKAAFVASDSGSCGNSFKRFTVTGPGTNPQNIVSYKWKFGDGTTLMTDTSVVVHEYTATGTVNVKLIITDIHGCNDTSVTPLQVKLFGPRANFTPPYSRICAGSAITFTDSTLFDPGNPLTKWNWNFGDGTNKLFTSGPFQHIYSKAGVYDVTLTVTDSSGCVDSIRKSNAVVVYKPNADFVSDDTVVCLNSPALFTNLSTGVQIKSSWTFGNGKVSSVSNPSTKYDSLGKYDIQLIITDSLNCRDTLIKPKYISVENAMANFSISDSFTTCPPLLVVFNNKSTNSLLNEWNFGNGNTSSLVSPSHTYNSPGSFTAKLVVTGNGGCTDSLTRNIKIEGPYGDISYTPLRGCPPHSVNFVTHPFNTQYTIFDFSDGQSTITSDTIMSHVYAIPGNYIPKVIFSDGRGCQLPIQGLDTIRVIGAKAFIKSLPQYYFCDTASIQFFDSTITIDNINSYKWDFGDGSQSSDQNPAHAYNRPGKYIVTLEVKTFSGCVSKDTLNSSIIIATTPQVTIGSDSGICVPASVQYKAVWLNKDTSRLAWQWAFGNGETSDLFSPPPVYYNKPGKYPISFAATNLYGCRGISGKVITINDSPKVVAGPPAYICLGNSVQLSATGGVSYKWSSNASLSCLNCQSPVAKPVTDQVYSAMATDSNGCKASDTVLVRVKHPVPVIVAKGDTLCAGESFQLSATGTEKYTWSPATGLSSITIANPIARPSATTDYMVIGYDELKCFADTGYVKLIVYPVPVFNIVEEKITAFTGSVVNIATTSSSDVIRWQWTPSLGLSCTDCPQPVATINLPRTYTATVYNEGNCRSEDKIMINPVCNQDNVFIPNTFSPNGDGQNDLFYPRAKGYSTVKNMQVFNRWGEMVFEKKDFPFNDPAAGWDGTYKGSKLTADVYVYVVNVLCDNSEAFSLKGNVTLLR